MKSYTFSTFQELIDQVPADRIKVCMAEVAALFTIAKRVDPKAKLRLPMTWIDDGLGDITATFHAPDATLSIKSKIQQEGRE